MIKTPADPNGTAPTASDPQGLDVVGDYLVPTDPMDDLGCFACQ